MSIGTVFGTPGPIFLPARRWEWKYISGPFSLDIPNNEGDFCALKKNISNDVSILVDFGVITKALFSHSVYPKLEENQVFSINAVIVDDDNNKICIVGNVLERI